MKPATSLRNYSLAILVVDDDPFALELLRHRLEAEIPGAQVTTRSDADVAGQFDVYLLDNQFAGTSCAGALASEVRARHDADDALVLAISAKLDRETLFELVNAGCNGAFDKGEVDDLDRAIALIRTFGEQRAEFAARGNLTSVVGSLRALLDSWNQRLRDLEEVS